MAIIEAVLFNNELELLDARFHEGDGIVDRWVIIESTETFTGKPKPLHFAEAKRSGRYADYLDRVIDVTIEPRAKSEPWAREAEQRDTLFDLLRYCNGSDLIVLSDGDELTRWDVWPLIMRQTANGHSVSLHKPTWYYTLTWQLQDLYGGDNSSYRSKAARVSTLRSYGKVSDWADDRYFPTIPESGWHLSCLGGPARLLNKLQSFSHQEINTPEWATYENCKKMIAEGIDCAPFRNAPLVRTEPSGPEWLIEEGVKRYPWLLTGEDPCTQPS